VKLNADEAQVIVGPREALVEHDIMLSSLNWIGSEPVTEEPIPVYAKIRSSRAAVPASLRFTGNKYIVTIHGGESGVSPGQACVLYGGQGSGARLLGGGSIARQGTPDNMASGRGEQLEAMRNAP
jgi:tRNA-uridine 2-sulfurtransferase